MKARSWLVCAAATFALASCVFATDFDAFTAGYDAGAGADAATDGPSPPPPTMPDADVDSGFDAAPLGPPTWRRAATTGPAPRHSTRMAYDEARAVTWLYGGWIDPNASATNELWSWNGTAWSGPMTSSGPSGRHGGLFVYDAARQVVVLFGGPGAPGPSDTWQWDGIKWLEPATPAAPTMIQVNGAWDADRGAVVLFGGHDATRGNVDETWEWNGIQWAKQSPPNAPPPRTGHATAYDVDRKKIVVFGGQNNVVLNDTWEYDGAWTPRSSNLVVPARHGACIAYHAARHVTVLFGGADESHTALSDTWLWDGTTWTPGPSGPTGRFSCTMAYDAARRAVVLFGGSTRYVDASHREVAGDTWVLE